MSLNQLLVELDGFKESSGVIVMGATNLVETIDPALLRPGRFDTQIVVHKPYMPQREKILKFYGSKIEIDKNVDFNIIAKTTTNASAADLANIVNSSAIRAATLGKDKVSMEDIIYARDKVTMGAQSKSMVKKKYKKKFSKIILF